MVTGVKSYQRVTRSNGDNFRVQSNNTFRNYLLFDGTVLPDNFLFDCMVPSYNFLFALFFRLIFFASVDKTRNKYNI